MRSNSNNTFTTVSRDRGNPYSDDIFDRRSGDGTSYYQTRLGSLSTLLLSDDASNPDQLQRRLRIYSSFLLCASIFFWTWAMYNTHHLRKKNPDGVALDLGIFSFFGTSMSSLLMLRVALGGSLLACLKRRKVEEDGEFNLVNTKRKSENVDHCPPGDCLRGFTVLTHLIVVANYSLGLVFAMTAGRHIYIYFASYCFIFSILWLLIAMACWIVLGVYREAIRMTFGDEFVNKKSKNRFGCVYLCNCLLAYCYRKLTAGKQSHDTTTHEDEMNEDEEEDEDVIDEELQALYAGPGKKGYSNINH